MNRGALGALCERTWHDRLEVVAEGASSAFWRADGSLHEVELHFAPADATEARDAAREVFPGCPLTFRLAEALRVSPLPIERFVLPETSVARHEIRVHPHLDALFLVVERAWKAELQVTRLHRTEMLESLFVPRLRQWRTADSMRTAR